MFQIVDYSICRFYFFPLKSVFYSSRERFKKVLGWLVISKTNIELISLFQCYITAFSGVTQVQSEAYTAENK